MSGMLRTLWVFVVLIALCWAGPAAALRCGTSVVKQGDSSYRVSRHCPEPFWVDRWEGPGVSAHYSGTGYTNDQYEAWYLNFGSRKQMRRLVFRNGRLEREVELGYGFNSVPQRCSARELEAAGPTLAEVFARCGPPDFNESWPVVVQNPYRDAWGRYRGSAQQLVVNDRWIYEFGGRADVRILEFHDGRLMRLQRERP